MSEQDLRLLSYARMTTSAGLAASIRERAGLSQGEIARTLGVSAAAVSRWESGKLRSSGSTKRQSMTRRGAQHVL